MLHLLMNFCPLCGSDAVRFAHVLRIDAPLARWQLHCHEGAWAHITSDKDGLDHVVFMTGAIAPPSDDERRKLAQWKRGHWPWPEPVATIRNKERG